MSRAFPALSKKKRVGSTPMRLTSQAESLHPGVSWNEGPSPSRDSNVRAREGHYLLNPRQHAYRQKSREAWARGFDDIDYAFPGQKAR